MLAEMWQLLCGGRLYTEDDADTAMTQQTAAANVRAQKRLYSALNSRSKQRLISNIPNGNGNGGYPCGTSLFSSC